MNNNKNKGITLIALVITIIVMLILVAVTISMAVNGGLFDYAGKATGETKNAIDVEQTLANGRVNVNGIWYDDIDAYINNQPSENQKEETTEEKVELPEGIKVGDYVNYTPTAGTYTVASGENGSGYNSNQTFTTETGESALKWVVWSIKEETGEIELASATVAQTGGLCLQGPNGYNHAVDILNDLCETLYSREENGEKVAVARSIKVEDINAKATYDYETESEVYGNTKKLSEYGTGETCPKLYSQETGFGNAGVFQTGMSGSDGIDDGVTDESGVTTYSTITGYERTSGIDPYVTGTYYGYYPESDEHLNKEIGINTISTGMINLGTEYWLSSRYVGIGTNWPVFGMRIIYSDGSVSVATLQTSSSNSPSGSQIAVRPVVYLGTKATLKKDTKNSTDEVTYWNIEF